MIGWLMIAALFAVFFYVLTNLTNFRTAVSVFVVAGAICGWVSLAVQMMGD